MATIEPYETKAGRRYRVRYRRPNGRSTDKSGFRTKRDATLWMSSLEVAKAEGSYISPSAGKATVGELGQAWLARQADWKPSYRYTMESTWHTHVLPRWGDYQVAKITRADVQEWIAGLNRSRSVASRCVTILSSILDDAVTDRLIHSNRAKDLALPRPDKRPRVYLDHQQVEDFATAAGDNGIIIRTLAYTGLRWGELAGLHGPDVDPIGRRISINRNAVQVGSKIIVGTPKTHELRTVPMPEFLAEDMRGRLGDDIVFPSRSGGYQRAPRASEKKRSWWRTAMLDAGIPEVTPHSLRHTAASLAIQSGAHVKAVQRMLGHASAAMTLDTYTDLFDSDLDAVAVALGDRRAEVLAR